MKLPLISIVVTSYNYQDYLKITLESILRQTYTNFEVIVFDDGSKDNSVEVIKEFEKKDSRIKLYQHEGGVNKGIVETTKAGIMKASGDLIAFCESDDYWVQDTLEKRMQYISQNPDAVIFVNDVEMFGDQEIIKQRQHVRETIDQMAKYTTPKNIFTELYYRNVISTFSAVTIRADILKKCNFDTPVSAILDWWLYRQISFNNIIGFIPEKLSFWRIHPQSIISSNKEEDRTKYFIKKNNEVIKNNNYNYYTKMFYIFGPNAIKRFLFRYRIKNGAISIRIFGMRILKIKLPNK